MAYQSWRSPTGDPLDYNYDIMTRRFVLPCEPDATTLCLQDGRFQVRALWRDYAARRGVGQTIGLTGDSGGFWFFAPGNLELLVKLVDGCGFNDRFWIYAGGLTDIDVDLLVTDTWSGEVRLFENALGEPFPPVQQIDLFSTCSAPVPLPKAGVTPGRVREGHLGDSPGDSCAPDASTLCFDSGRFRVRSEWHDFAGASGTGMAEYLGEESGYFWFFDPESVEVAVKWIDGCDFNDRYWIYASGLTNVAVDLTVEDTLNHRTWTRETRLGEAFPAFLDASAFATCP